MKPSSAPKLQAQHVMLFGDPKSGKSTLVAELANHGYKLLWVAFDRGYGVIYKLPQEVYDNNIELIKVTDTTESPTAIATANYIMTGLAVNLCDEHGIKDCQKCRLKKLAFTNVCVSDLGPEWIIVLDHMSQVADSAVALVTKGKPEEYKLDYDDWRTQGNWMKKIFTNIQACDHHVICLAHVLEAENDEGKKKLVPEVGTRNFSVNSTKYFDHVVYCRVDNLKHRFGSSTTWMNNILTGSRTDVAIEHMAEASLLPIFHGLIPGQFDVGNMNGAAHVKVEALTNGTSAGSNASVSSNSSNSPSVGTNGTSNSSAVGSDNPEKISDKQSAVQEAEILAMEEAAGIEKVKTEIIAKGNNSLDAVKARLAAMRGAR